MSDEWQSTWEKSNKSPKYIETLELPFNKNSGRPPLNDSVESSDTENSEEPIDEETVKYFHNLIDYALKDDLPLASKKWAIEEFGKEWLEDLSVRMDKIRLFLKDSKVLHPVLETILKVTFLLRQKD